MTTDFTQMNTKAWITPAEKLIAKWTKETEGNVFDVVCLAAQWGANQELEVCCKYLTRYAAWKPEAVAEFLDHRRPEPPSLKEQAFQALYDVAGDLGAPFNPILHEQMNTIRQALEQLDD